jgi:hypothetical protein
MRPRVGEVGDERNGGIGEDRIEAVEGTEAVKLREARETLRVVVVDACQLELGVIREGRKIEIRHITTTDDGKSQGECLGDRDTGSARRSWIR